MSPIWRWTLRNMPLLRGSAIQRGNRQVLDEKAQTSNGRFASRGIGAIKQSRKQRQRCSGVYIAKGLGGILLNEWACRGCESTQSLNRGWRRIALETNRAERKLAHLEIRD